MEKIIFTLTQIKFVKHVEMTNAHMDEQSTNLQMSNEERASDIMENKSVLEKRQLPPRISKLNSGLGIKHHAIAKRNQEKLKDFTNIKPRDILELYTNNSLKNFKPSGLETIIEEPTDGEDVDELDSAYFIKSRKLKRFTNFATPNPSKYVINKRRAKIKKIFGRRPSATKMTMEEFLEKFNNDENLNDDLGEK